MLDKITADEAYRMGIVTTLALRVGVKASRELVSGRVLLYGLERYRPVVRAFSGANDVRPFMRTVLRAIYVFPYLLVAIAGLIFVLVRYQRHPEDRRRADLFLVVCLFGPFLAIAVERTIHELCC